jgi:CheY-like chemotaxis protein
MAITPLSPRYTSLVVVDDNPDDTAILKRAAQNFGIKRADFFVTGEQALEFLRKKPADVALVDYHLPGMNGLRLIEQMRNEFPRLDVILVTGVRDERIAADAIKLGAKDYLCKDEFVTGGIIRALQATLRDRIASEEADLREGVSSPEASLAVASLEAKWLIEELSRHYQYDLAHASLGSDLEMKDIADAFSSYLIAAFETFPETPTREEGDLVRTIIERGLSPRQVALVYGLALRWIAADTDKKLTPPFSPALCLVQVLAQLVEHYQSQLTMGQLSVLTGGAAIANAA